MEYKLSSFKFCPEMDRDDKHLVIKKINSIRSKCPSDATFTGSFYFKDNLLFGEIKVLFSRGTFFVSNNSTSVGDLAQVLINSLEDQISCWKNIRFDQPETFINYNEYLSEVGKATG